MASPTIDCDRAAILIAASTERALDRDETAGLDHHLASCAACREAAEVSAELAPTFAPEPADIGEGDLGDLTLPTIDPELYLWREELRRGGMGRIVRARDRRLGREVAIKELLSPTLRVRFEREASITARLQHPAIVPVYEAGAWPNGDAFYAMKLVGGRALDDIIRGTTTLRERIEMLPPMIGVADAIAYAHSERVIHRDIKPSNILIGAFGEAVVIDWGLAKQLSDVSADADGPAGYRADATWTHDTVGTPCYMPPEQAHGAPADPRFDVYALGATLYHVLSGQQPYAGSGNAYAVLVKLDKGPPTPLASLVPDLPRELVTIVDKAMARRPDDRYPSARELVDDLKRYQTGQLVSAHAYSVRELASRWIRRHRAPVVVAALGLALASGLGAMSVRRIIDERDRAAQARDQAMAAQAAVHEEQGRRELAEGHPAYALLHLQAAYQLGARHNGLRQLLARAAAPFDRIETQLDNSPGDGEESHAPFPALEIDRGGRYLLANNETSASVFDLAARGREPVVRVPLFERRWHRDAVIHDGKLIAVTPRPGPGTDVTAVVVTYDLATRREMSSFALPSKVWRGTLSADGERVVSEQVEPSGERLIVVQDRTGREHNRYPVPPRQGPGEFAFDLVGGLLFLGRRSLLDVATGLPAVELANLPPHAELIAAGEGGDLLAFATADAAEIHVYSRATGARISRIPISVRDSRWVSAPLIAALPAARLSPDERLLLVHVAGEVQLWDVRGAAPLATLTSGGPATCATFSPDGQRIATCHIDATVRVWDARGETVLSHLQGHERPGVAAFSPGGDRIATAGEDNRIIVWTADPQAPQQGRRAVAGGATVTRPVDPPLIAGAIPMPAELATDRASAGDRVQADASADGSTVLVAGRYHVELWDRAGPTLRWKSAATSLPLRLARLSPDGRSVVVAHGNPAALDVLDAATGQPRRSFAVGRAGEYISAADVAADGRVALALAGGRVVIVAPAVGVERESFPGHTRPIEFLALVGPGERRLLTADRHRIRLSDATTGQVTAFDPRHRRIADIAVAADERMLAIATPPARAGGASTIEIWDMASGHMLYELVSRVGEIERIDDFPDGRLTAHGRDTWETWDLRGETRSPAEIAALAERASPYKLVAGHVVLRDRR